MQEKICTEDHLHERIVIFLVIVEHAYVGLHALRCATAASVSCVTRKCAVPDADCTSGKRHPLARF